MAQYGKKEYWEERYKNEKERFEWYQSYSGIKDIITQHMKRDANILCVGCGNSTLSEEMWKDGFKNITNIDHSENVIDKMRTYYKEKNPDLKYQIMNV